MISGLSTVGYFIFSLVFSLLLLVLWLRIGLRYFQVTPFNAISQSVYRLTNPWIAPLAKCCPKKLQTSRRLDWGGVIALIGVELVKFSLAWVFFYRTHLPFAWMGLYVLADLIIQPATLLFYAILLRVIMSWINPYWQHPLADVVRVTTDPLLRIGRRIIPDISGFDFSPYLMIVILKIITLFLNASLPLPVV